MPQPSPHPNPRTLTDVLAAAGIVHASGGRSFQGRILATATADGEALGAYEAHEAWRIVRSTGDRPLVPAFRETYAQAAASRVSA